MQNYCTQLLCSSVRPQSHHIISPLVSLSVHPLLSLASMIVHSSSHTHCTFCLFFCHIVLFSIPLSLQIIANHHMQSISFASGGDPVSHVLSLNISFYFFLFLLGMLIIIVNFVD